MNNAVISYKTLRRAIGILALLFPLLQVFFIVINGPWTETSISATYWSNAGVIFIGMLMTFSIFLFAYKGYDKIDDALTNVMAVGMFLVVIFPCEGGDTYLFNFIAPKATRIIHYIAAGVTFSMMGVVSLVLFTRGEKDMPQKKKRNRVYRACAYVIFGAIAGMLLLEIVPGARDFTTHIRLFYWLESVVVWTFGVSWLVKGETLFKD